ncbi:hypothetical protein FKP32DRAFT_1562909, partial [Trametes sanguinea]
MSHRNRLQIHPDMSAPLELNPDVLEAICNAVDDRQTMCSLSLTCWSLRELAIKRLLGMQPLLVRGGRHLHALHSFLIADEPRRFSHLRGLHLVRTKGERYTIERIARYLIDIFKHAAGLEYLELPNFNYFVGAGGDYLEDDLPLREAIHQLSSLRELVITRMWPYRTTDETFRSIRSPLKVVRIHRGDDGMRVEYPLGPMPIEFPAVRSVRFSFRTEPPWVDALVQMFPTLDRVLQVEKLKSGSYGASLKADIASQRSVRAHNKKTQQTRAWKHIDFVTSDVHMLYMLGLTCTVRHLMVDRACAHQKERIADILDDTRPVYLKLSIELWHGDDIFEDLFRSEATSRITHL